jgi:hypothetical protein
LRDAASDAAGQVAAYLYIGHVELMWPLVVAVTGFVSLIASTIVVTCARLYRFLRKNQRQEAS